MTAPAEATLNYGARYAALYELNANRRPKASGITFSQGQTVQGYNAFTLNIPDPREITGIDGDSVSATAYLPPITGATGEISVDGTNPTLIALITAGKARTIGELISVGLGTSQQGYEPKLGLMVYQAAQGLDTGANYWHTYIFPSIKSIYMAHGQNDNKGVARLKVSMSRVKKYLWGPAYTLSSDGFLASQGNEIWSNGRVNIASFLGDNSTTVFLFDTDRQALSTATITVYVDGVAVTSGITKAVTGVTWASAPATNADIQIVYEW